MCTAMGAVTSAWRQHIWTSRNRQKACQNGCQFTTTTLMQDQTLASDSSCGSALAASIRAQPTCNRSSSRSHIACDGTNRTYAPNASKESFIAQAMLTNFLTVDRDAIELISG